jgi:hypothetical protein
MEQRFRTLDYQISAMETVTSQYNLQHLENLTQGYIALTREYAEELGADQARQRLAAKADELAPYCLPCSGTLFERGVQVLSSPIRRT